MARRLGRRHAGRRWIMAARVPVAAGMALAMSVPVAAQAPAPTAASTARSGAAPCRTTCLTPGDHQLTLDFRGTKRTYLVHVPRDYTGATPVPLLIDMHGWGSNPGEQRFVSGQLQQSDQRGFIAVWPQGQDNSWNGFNCCGKSMENNVDDVGFLRALVNTMKGQANIAGDRVYASGLSNGWSMAMRAACDAADVFRAAAGVSQMLNQPERCRPSRPIGITSFHGLLDLLAPYGGNPLLGFQSARTSFASWATINRCTGAPVRGQLSGLSRTETFIHCAGKARVGLVTVGAGGHITYLNLDGVNIAGYIWDVAFAH